MAIQVRINYLVPLGTLGLGCLRHLIRAAVNRMRISPPYCADGNLSCFLDILPVIVEGSKPPDSH